MGNPCVRLRQSATEAIRQPGESRTRNGFQQPTRPRLRLTLGIKSSARFLWRSATELEKLRCPVGDHDVQSDLKKLRFPPRYRLPATQE